MKELIKYFLRFSTEYCIHVCNCNTDSCAQGYSFSLSDNIDITPYLAARDPFCIAA